MLPSGSGAIFLTSSTSGRERRCSAAARTSSGSSGPAKRGAVQTAQTPAVARAWIVELLLQRAHQAAPVGAERGHRRLFVAAQLR
jgi:hypothetical protein